MKKSAIVMLLAVFLSMTALAQSVQEGINHLYAQRFQSARTSFEKLIAANPNNIEANYWLGQAYLAQKNVAGAKAVYEKAAAASNNAPLLMVGLGHVALLEGKGPEARQQFEAAIAATRGKKGNDPNILNAVGRANVDAYTEATKLGDLDYAIAKLTEAAQLAPNNPDIYLNLGNAYRKKRDSGSGGLAITSYTKAKSLNQSLAVAPYRAAMLYKTQVNYRQPDSWSVVLDNLNAALAADPNFAPAYEELYYYYLLGKKDFPTAETYATKYIAASDPSVENDYLKAQTDFVQNKFADAITIGKNIISQTNNTAKPRVYRLLAYSYMGVKDTATACDFASQFFTKATDDDIIGQDYLLHAQACGKNNPDVILADVTKAVQIDSVPSRQVDLLNGAIDDAKKSGQRLLEGYLGLIRYKILGERASNAQLVNLGIPFYYGSDFKRADSLFQEYNKAFPDSIYGYLWSSKANIQIDTNMAQGLAVPAYEQMLRVAETDKTRDLYKSYGAQAAGYLAVYYNNIKADKATATTYVDRGLVIDPTNATLLNIQKALRAAATRPPAQRPGGTSTNTPKPAAPKKTK
jgi:tetratricopeptide (TPR) repeat protein